jgi:hypothetical protein
MRYFISLLLLSQLMACGAGDGTGLDANGQPVGETPAPGSEPEPDPQALQATLTSIQEHVLTPICAQCHVGNNAPLGLRMDDLETSIANLINVDAVTNGQFKRINPGQSAEQSFLFLKISGDPQAGNQMPLGQTPLSAETIAVFRQWIESGAPIDDQQLIVAQSKLLVTPDKQSLSVSLRFSQPLDQALFQIGDIEIMASNENAKWSIDTSNAQLTWLNAYQLEVMNIPLDAETRHLAITLNQASSASVFSQSGVWLDGDRDGNAGGEYHYEHQF